MTKFLILFSYSDTAVERMLNHPADRATVVTKLLEAGGGRLESFYWMLGSYDGAAIAELPDATTAASLALAVVGAHAMKRFETFELIPHESIAGIEEKAREMGRSYQPPGQER